MMKKVKLQNGSSPAGTPVPTPPPPQQTPGHMVLEPLYSHSSNEKQVSNIDGAHTPHLNPSHPPAVPLPHASQQSQNVDPELFAPYPHSETNGTYGDHNYDFHHDMPAQPYHMPNGYQIPSLEQIASEVLDMSGNEPQEHDPLLPDGLDRIRAFNADDVIVSMPNGLHQSDGKPDGSVDSAVSLPVDGAQEAEQDGSEGVAANGEADARESHGVAALPKGGVVPNGLPTPLPSSEESVIQPQRKDATSLETTDASASTTGTKKDNASDLPLWSPPAPLLQSPSSAKKQDVTNGVHSPSGSPGARRAEPGLSKRMREPTPSTSEPRPGKKIRVNGMSGKVDAVKDVPLGNGVQEDEESKSVELARLLQQEDLGLRRRSSRGGEAVR